MNRWDLFTWIMSIVLGAGSLTVFVFFLKDLRGLLGGGQGDGTQGKDGVDRRE